MPIYEFSCNSCKKTFERFVMSHRDIKEVNCPKCGSYDVSKLMSSFSCGSGCAGASSFNPLGNSCAAPSGTRFG